MQNSGMASAETNATDLFVLSDEQILDISPEADAPSHAGQATDPGSPGQQVSTNNQHEKTADRSLTAAASSSDASHESRGTSHDPAEPPAWLAAQMQDAWGGEEAREFWDGVQQARSEAAAYRASIASPEDARVLKELYPGGVNEARAAAERARLLDEVDRAYFGAAGNSPEQLSASRAQLAQRMLRDDPAAFREMVEAGIRALQEVTESQRPTGKSVASAVSDARHDASARSTGGSSVGAQRAAPLHEKLASSIRGDVEKALQGDRQLGEQVAQILSSRRLDNESRSQIVRLISERAQQLVPGAAKRVLNEWTQTTLAAHRGRTERADAASARTDLPPATVPARSGANDQANPRRHDVPRGSGQVSTTKSHTVNYRKLSDEQILEM